VPSDALWRGSKLLASHEVSKGGSVRVFEQYTRQLGVRVRKIRGDDDRTNDVGGPIETSGRGCVLMESDEIIWILGRDLHDHPGGDGRASVAHVLLSGEVSWGPKRSYRSQYGGTTSESAASMSLSESYGSNKSLDDARGEFAISAYKLTTSSLNNDPTTIVSTRIGKVSFPLLAEDALEYRGDDVKPEPPKQQLRNRKTPAKDALSALDRGSSTNVSSDSITRQYTWVLEIVEVVDEVRSARAEHGSLVYVDTVCRLPIATYTEVSYCSYSVMFHT